MHANEASSEGHGDRGILVVVTLILFTVVLCYDLLVPILPDYATHWNLSEGQIGLLFGAYAITLVLAVPISGWVCDRFGGMRGLQFGTMGLAAGQLLYACASGPAMLFIARVLQGGSAGIAETAGLALLAGAYPAGRRGQALGTAMAGMSVGTLLGPPLGGALYAWGGMRCPFFVMAGWTLALVGLLALCPRRWASTPTTKRPAVLAGWSNYLGTVLVVMLGAGLLTSLEPTLPLHMSEQFGATPEQSGLLFGLAALVYGIVSPLAGWLAERWNGRWVMLGGLTGCVLLLPLIALPRTWVVEAAVLAAFGIACTFLLTPALPEIAAVCERSKTPTFGAAYASFNLAYAAGMVFGPVSGGLLKRTVGFSMGLLVLSGFALVVLPFLVLRLRREQADITCAIEESKAMTGSSSLPGQLAETGMEKRVVAASEGR